jgi:HSP20 family protein
MQALQKQIFGDDFTSLKAVQMPMTDIYTLDNKHMVVEAHLPNFDEKDISVHTDKGVLEIQAEKHEKEEDKKRKYVVRESSSSFYRRVRLPDVANEDKIEAHLEDGILKVVVPFKELPAPKKISVKKIAKSATK